MKSLRLLLLSLAACSGTPSTDAGLDAGTVDAGATDAGPRCEGVPSRLNNPPCQELSVYATICGSSRDSTVAREFETCDAGPGIVGYLGVGNCGEFATVEWTYGPPGDTYTCYFAADGGALVGVINYTDRGPLVAGRVGECTAGKPPMCP
jgi:hypothetical protein